jgi:hypothetical protein
MDIERHKTDTTSEFILKNIGGGDRFDQCTLKEWRQGKCARIVFSDPENLTQGMHVSLTARIVEGKVHVTSVRVDYIGAPEYGLRGITQCETWRAAAKICWAKVLKALKDELALSTIEIVDTLL